VATTATKQHKILEAVPAYTSGGNPPPKGAKDEARFTMDGEQYVLRRPKMAIAMTMLRLAEGESEQEMGMDLIRLLSAVIAYIKKEPPAADGTLRGQARLMHRLSDPDDLLDLLDLNQPFQDLIAQVYENPTGSPTASGRRRNGTSVASVERTRSPRAVTSTT